MVKKITEMQIIDKYLTDYGRTYFLGELASLLKKPHQSVKPYLETLVKQNILKKTKRRNIVDYSLNFKDKKIYDYLVIAEKERLIRRLGKDTLINILFEKLFEHFTNCTFVLFGSSIENVKEAADIDLLIIGKKDMSEVLEYFEEVYDKKIHLIQIDDLGKIDLAFVKEIYKKHLILNNTEYIVRFFGSLHGQNKLV